MIHEFKESPSATYKWGATGCRVSADHKQWIPDPCRRWFKTRANAVRYARGSVWEKYFIARFFS